MKEEYQKEFLALLDEIHSVYGAVGIAVAIVRPGEEPVEIFHGYRDCQNKLPVNRDTIFGLASVTKSFTCLAVLKLAEQGKIDLNAPVSRYVPSFTNKNRPPVLVRHLMSHAGSFWPVERKNIMPLAKKLGVWQTGVDLAYDKIFAEEAVKLVAADLDAQDEPLGVPGQYLSYSNDSFGLLSEIIRTEGGEDSYAEYMIKHILAPLGMTRSYCDFLKPVADDNAAILYEREGGQMTASRDYYDNAFVLMGGGSLKSTLADMEKAITMHLAGGAPLISEAMHEKMCTPYVSYRPGEEYGYGLGVSYEDGAKICGHAGSLTGVSSAIRFCHEKGVGVVVLCNTGGAPSTLIATAALRLALGKSPCPPGPAQTAPWPADRMQKAAGVYLSQEDSEVRIDFDGQAMRVYLSGKEYPYRFAGDDAVFLQTKMTWTELQLFFDAAGEVFALRHGARMHKKIR